MELCYSSGNISPIYIQNLDGKMSPNEMKYFDGKISPTSSTNSSCSINIEEAWPPELEATLLEAIMLYKTSGKRKIRDAQGNLYGRNQLIATYIYKKCGKIRSPRQIASHIQVLQKKWYLKSKIEMPFKLTELFMSKNFQNYPIRMNESGIVSVLNNKVQSGAVDDFINYSYIVDRLFSGPPMRTVSSEKLSMISFVDYIFDMEDNSKTILLLTTFATEKSLPEISLSSIQHIFDSTLTDLFHCLPKDIFYVAHIWMNMDFTTESLNFMSEQVYFSPHKFDIDIMGVDCFYGSTIASFHAGGFNIEEVTVSNQKYYVYHLKVLWPNTTISFIKNFAKLKQDGEYKSLKNAMNSYACLTVLTDVNTCEVLLVIAHIYEYSADKAAYKFYRLVE